MLAAGEFQDEGEGASGLEEYDDSTGVRRTGKECGVNEE